MAHFLIAAVKQLLLVVILLSCMGMQSVYYQTHATSFFKIKYEKRVPSKEVLKIGTMLENSYAKFKRKLDISLSNRVDAFLLTSADRLRAESKTKVFDDAVYKNGKMYIALPEKFADENKLKRAVARVVARSVIDEVKACPQWLAEAYSIYAGGDVARFGQPSRLNVLTFADLAEDYSRAEGAEETKEMYAKLGSTAAFLVSRYGEAKVDTLFVQFKNGKSSKEVFEATFGEKIGVIEKAWVKALAQPIQE